MSISPDEGLPPIVIDPGSSHFKVGFSGDDVPVFIFPSLIGELKTDCNLNTNCISKKNGDVLFVGSDTHGKEADLALSNPIHHGIVTDWDKYEHLLAHSFEMLCVDPEEHEILISDQPLNPSSHKERTTELIFEAFQAPAFFLADSSQLNLYACGRHTGIMIDVGDGVTTTIPFCESRCNRDGIERQDFGGRDLTLFLQRLLHDKGFSFTTPSELEMVKTMKEKFGFVSTSTTRESNNNNSLDPSILSSEKVFSLPDGSKVMLNKERFLCAEALFDPTLAGFPFLKGLPDLILNSLKHCDRDAYRDICVSFMISGGCAMFPGFRDRLRAELELKLPKNLSVRVNPARIDTHLINTWIGGSIVSSLSTFQDYWISKSDYFEYGPAVVLHKS